jgi:Diguanylate cyclase, GGDEF domain
VYPERPVPTPRRQLGGSGRGSRARRAAVAGTLDLVHEEVLAIQSAIRTHDLAARLGGDEFAVLAIHAGVEDAPVLEERLREAFASVGVEASIRIRCARARDRVLATQRFAVRRWGRPDA